MPIGQRVVSRYVKHPAVASGHLADGDPLDAGTAHIVHSNLSHLSERNVRLVAHALGPGEVDWQGAWSGVIDETQIVGAVDVYSLIPWYRDRTAKLFGPLALSMARVQTAPAGLVPRKVRVVVQGTKSAMVGTDLYVYAVLTATCDTPIRSLRYATATASKSAGGSDTLCVFNLTLTPELVRPTQEWPCREASSGLGATAAITPAWLWVGWRSTTTLGLVGSDPDTIESVSVFEIWE